MGRPISSDIVKPMLVLRNFLGSPNYWDTKSETSLVSRNILFASLQCFSR